MTSLKAYKPGKENLTAQIVANFQLMGLPYSKEFDTSSFTCGSFKNGVLVEADPVVSITNVDTEINFEILPQEG